MPNCCRNELYFDDDAALADVMQFMGSGFDFNRLIPYPARFAKLDADWRLSVDGRCLSEDGRAEFVARWGDTRDGYSSGGNRWCREHWGAMWGAGDVHIEDEHLVFDTAWAPPIPVIEALAVKFPQHSMHLEFFEGGMAFCGGCSYLNERDYDGECDWEPGIMSHVWHGKYRGHKGG